MTGRITAGTLPDEIVAVDQDTDRLTRLWEHHGVCSVEVPGTSVTEVVMVAVKPHHVATALTDIALYLGPEAVTISMAAGVALTQLTEVLSEGQPVVRVMPNMPMLVSRGVAGLATGPTVTLEQIARVAAMMEAVGICIELPENQSDALTVIPGPGPIYLFLIAEATIEAGVHQGLGWDVVARLVNGTFAGAAAILERADASATKLWKRVISLASATTAALWVLDEKAVRAALLAAVEVCARRSSEP